VGKGRVGKFRRPEGTGMGRRVKMKRREASGELEVTGEEGRAGKEGKGKQTA